MSDAYLTIEEAVSWLDPAISSAALKHLVLAAELEPHGVRYTGRPGRPGYCYRMSEIAQLHAAFIPLMARLGGVNASFAQGLAKMPS